MAEIAFVDAHMHLWELDALRYPWLAAPFTDAGPNGSVAAIARDYLPADYRADLAGWRLAGAVHVEAGADPRDAAAESAWLDRQADATGLPGGYVAHAALDDPALSATLAQQVRHPRLRGIRHIVNWHPDLQRSYTARDVTRDPAWAAGFARLAGHGLSFDLQCYPAQMPAVAAIVARHPQVPVAIDHLGMPVMTDANGLDDWRTGMRALAALPQVMVKLSGPGFIWRDWDAARLEPLVREALDLFGAGRILVASNAPTDTLFGTVAQHLSAYADILGDLSLDERRDLFGRNADRFYRLRLEL